MSLPGERLIGVGRELFMTDGSKLLQFSSQSGWITKTENSDLSIGRIVEFAGCLYVVTSNTMSAYDPVQDIWTEGLPGTGLDVDCLIASQTSLFSIENNYWNNCTVKQFQKGYLSRVDVDFPRSTGVALGGNIYAMGGRLKQNVKKWDFQTESWSDISPLLNSSNLDGIQAIAAQGKIYVIHGMKVQKEYLAISGTVESYDTSTNEWKIISEESNLNIFSLMLTMTKLSQVPDACCGEMVMIVILMQF